VAPLVTQRTSGTALVVILQAHQPRSRTMRAAPKWAVFKLSAPLLMVGAAAALALGMAAPAWAGVQGTPGQVQVEVVGEGRPLLMIPGLNSSAAVWRETCLALRGVQCHLVQLPGFAGAAAADPMPEAFLPAMRDQLLAYVRSGSLQQPAVIGHSLGGVLALQMALSAPDDVGPLVIVDALPFYAAIQNPAATADSMQAVAAHMRQSMLASDDASYQAQSMAALQGMTTSADHLETLKAWGRTSDRRATADAMYSMLVNDLRAPLVAVRSPTLVLGAWAAYRSFGATEQSTRAIFQAQYAALPGVRISMSKAGYHFLMWDDPQWLQEQVQQFLDDNR